MISEFSDVSDAELSEPMNQDASILSRPNKKARFTVLMPSAQRDELTQMAEPSEVGVSTRRTVFAPQEARALRDVENIKSNLEMTTRKLEAEEKRAETLDRALDKISRKLEFEQTARSFERLMYSSLLERVSQGLIFFQDGMPIYANQTAHDLGLMGSAGATNPYDWFDTIGSFVSIKGGLVDFQDFCLARAMEGEGAVEQTLLFQGKLLMLQASPEPSIGANCVSLVAVELHRL